MPNWCLNRLEISGRQNCVDDFITGFTASGFADRVPEPFEGENVMQWYLDHWGTRWNVSTDEHPDQER